MSPPEKYYITFRKNARLAHLQGAHYNVIVKMKQKVSTLLLLPLLLLMTSCLKFHEDVRVSKEAAVEVSGSFYLSESVLADSTARDQFGRYYDLSRLTETEDSSQLIEGNAYSGFRYQAEPSAYTAEKNGSEMTLRFSIPAFDDAQFDLDVLGGDDDLSALKDYGVETTITVEMPGKILSATAGEFEGKTLTIDLLQTNGTEVEVVSRIENKAVEAAIAVGGIAVLALLAYPLLRK